MASSSFRSLLEALDEPSMVVDKGVVLLANSAAKTLLGEGIEGGDVRLAIRHPAALEHILPAKPGEIEVVGIGAIGRAWTLSIRLLGDQLSLVRLMDRSASIAAERMRVDFVANASHELRTPLSTILGYAETLADDSELEMALRAKFGGVIRSESRRMLRIIEDLMNLSRIEAVRFVTPVDKVSVGEIVAIAVENVSKIAGDQCRVTVDVEGGLPLVTADPAQLTQLLDNLLTNASRYGCQAGECAIRVAATHENGFIRISVADDGPGIANAHLPRLTERFYRVDEARSRHAGGTGLGLAIVKHIVERHKGRLEIHSTVGEGTEVVVRLPVAP